MPKIAIDTNFYVAYIQGVKAAQVVLRAASEIYLPLPVLGELYNGFFNGTKQKENLAILKQFLNSPRVSVMIPTEQTAIVYGEIMTELKKAGKPMQTNDVWIAAISKELGASLATFDKGFENILGLETIE